ncbi:MAG: tRNA (adenosine(37)-N6)-threonylcarbamoyltransferase complex dimerization subunit type 1 TsaB [Gammaproteobacteria bacterium]
MNILAFDTSTAACSVALLIDDKIQNEHQVQARGHANLILGMIESLLAKAGVVLSDIDLVSFGQGPGSFTGLRIAAGVCQGIAYSQNIPVIALSSLRVLAQGVFREFNQHNIAILQDARMAEIYWGCYIESNGIMKLIGDENVSKPEMIQLDNTKNWYSVGEAWLSYSDEITISNVKSNTEFNYPDAIDMIALSKYEFENGNVIFAEQVNPVYIRNQVATVKK